MGGLTATSGGGTAVAGAGPTEPQFAPQDGAATQTVQTQQIPAVEELLSETQFTMQDLELAIDLLSLCVLLYWAHKEVR